MLDATLRDSSRALLRARPHRRAAERDHAHARARAARADAITPPRQSRQIAELIPDARLEEFQGAGHMLMYERTDDVDKLIIDFAARVPACDGHGRRPPASTADVITDVPGVRAGHWTGGHGVTVVVLPPDTVGVGARCAAARRRSRETALLDPARIVEHVDAIVLSGRFGVRARRPPTA